MVASQTDETQSNECGWNRVRTSQGTMRVAAPATLALDDVEALLIYCRPKPRRVCDDRGSGRGMAVLAHLRLAVRVSR